MFTPAGVVSRLSHVCALRYFCVAGLYMFCERVLFTLVLESDAVLQRLPPRSYMLKRMYERGFTRIMIFHLLSNTLNRGNSVVLEYLYSMACIATFAAFLSFHAVLLVDSGAHRRLGQHVGVELLPFTLGNLLVHGVPCVWTVVFPPQRLAWYHGVSTMLAQGLWGLLVTGGSYKLDDIYAPNAPNIWRTLWFVAQICNVVTPFAFNQMMIALG